MTIFWTKIDIAIENTIDFEHVRWDPCMGCFIPLLTENIPGLEEALYNFGFKNEKTKEVKCTYLYMIESCMTCALCVEYQNGEVRTVSPSVCELGDSEFKSLEMIWTAIIDDYDARQMITC